MDRPLEHAATGDEVGDGTGDAPRGRSAPRWSTRLGPHLLVLVIVIVAVAATSNLESSWTSDDGVYAVQAKLIRDQQRWDAPQRHPEADPDGRHRPLAHSTVSDEGRVYPYVKHPLWVVAMARASDVGGRVVGLHLPAYLGALAAASAAWALARRLGPGLEVPAFWAFGVGSVLVEATALWAHTAAAALGGLLALGVAGAATRRLSRAQVVGLAAVAAVAVLLRAEGLLAVAAAAGAMGLTGLWRWRSGADRLGQAIVVPAIVAAAGLLGRRLNGAWAAAIVSGEVVSVRSDSPSRTGSFVEDRTNGAIRTLVDGASDPVGSGLAVLVVVLAIAAGVSLRSRPGWTRGLILAAASVSMVAVRGFLADGHSAGFLVAVPLLAVGIGVWRWGRAPVPERAVALYLALNAGLVLVTQYPEGGGAEWGGRYLFFGLVPWTVLALCGLRRGLREAGDEPDPTASPLAGRALAVALAVAVVVPTLTGLAVTRQSAATNDVMARRMSDAEGETTILLNRFVGRWGWRDLPEADRLFAEPDEAGELLERLRPGVTGAVTVYGTGAEDIRADGYEREVVDGVEVVFRPEGDP